MTQATKSLAIIFVSLLVITGLVKWTDTSSSSLAFRSTLVDVEASQVNRMVVEAPTQNRTITLQRASGEWQVSGNGTETSYPADSSSIMQSISRLNGLSIQAVATRDPEKYTRFRVDSTGTTVSLYNGDQLLSSIVIGAPQIVSRQQRNTYVRPADGKAVYSVEGFLSATFNKDLDGWRDKQVWEFPEDQISRVDFLMPADSSYSIERTENSSWVSEGDTLGTAPVSRITSRLSSLQASGFVNDQSPENFGTELYAIQVQLSNGSQKTLRLKPDEDSTSYHAVASDFLYTFTLRKSTFDNSVLRSREELVQD